MITKPSEKFSVFSAVIIFALIAVVAYVVVRVLLLLLFSGGYNHTEKTLSVLLIIAELFIVAHGVGYILNILHSAKREKISSSDSNPVENEPAVAVLVAARHEPKEVLESTFIALKNLNYKNKDIYFLDDSSEEKYKTEAEELCDELGLKLFRRSRRRSAKAGIINDCLKILNHKYVSVFDADQNPLPEFLNTLVPIMENNDKLAFVQTPQFYTNAEESSVARGAAFQQAVFYEYICEGKGTGDSMFCCGTNVIFRLKALKSVEGFDESTVTEDFATSLKLHTSGWKSLYFDHVYAFGMGPENLAGYFKQQFRWANGTISVFKKILLQFITKPGSLSFFQWWEYFLSGSYYLIGFAFLFMMICPVMYLLFNVPSFFVKPEIYFLSFMPYLLLTMGIFYVLLGARHYRVKDLLYGQFLGACTFPIYIEGAVCAVLGIKTTFGITQKNRSNAVGLSALWPHITFILADFIAIVWGINRYVYEREPAILVNGAWVFYHLMVLSSVFYFNEGETKKIACKTIPDELKFEYNVLKETASIKGLSSATWRTCFRVFFKQEVVPGTLVMCKLRPPKEEALIFEAVVTDCSKIPARKGYEAVLGVFVVQDSDRIRLKKVLSPV